MRGVAVLLLLFIMGLLSLFSQDLLPAKEDDILGVVTGTINSEIEEDTLVKDNEMIDNDLIQNKEEDVPIHSKEEKGGLTIRDIQAQPSTPPPLDPINPAHRTSLVESTCSSISISTPSSHVLVYPIHYIRYCDEEFGLMDAGMNDTLLVDSLKSE